MKPKHSSNSIIQLKTLRVIYTILIVYNYINIIPLVVTAKSISSLKCSKSRLNEVLNLNRGGYGNDHDKNIPPPPPPPPPPSFTEGKDIPSSEEQRIESPSSSAALIHPSKPPMSLSSILKRKILRDKLARDYEKDPSNNNDDHYHTIRRTSDQLTNNTTKDTSSSLLPLEKSNINNENENVTSFLPQEIRSIPFYNHYHTMMIKDFNIDEFIVFPRKTDHDERRGPDDTRQRDEEKDGIAANSTDFTTKEDKENDLSLNNNDKNNPNETTSDKNTYTRQITYLLLLQSLNQKKQQEQQKQQYMQYENRIIKILSKFHTDYEQQQEHYQSTLLNKLQILLYDNTEMLLERIMKHHVKSMVPLQTKFIKRVTKINQKYQSDIINKLNQLLIQEKEEKLDILHTQKKRNKKRKRFISLLDSLDRENNDDASASSRDSNTIISISDDDDSEEQQQVIENNYTSKRNLDDNTNNGDDEDEVFENVLWDLMLSSSDDDDDDDEYNNDDDDSESPSE